MLKHNLLLVPAHVNGFSRQSNAAKAQFTKSDTKMPTPT